MARRATSGSDETAPADDSQAIGVAAAGTTVRITSVRRTCKRPGRCSLGGWWRRNLCFARHHPPSRASARQNRVTSRCRSLSAS